jgi:hypothetical protein
MVVVKTSGINFDANEKRTVNSVAYGSCNFGCGLKIVCVEPGDFLICAVNHAVSHHRMMMVMGVLMM